MIEPAGMAYGVPPAAHQDVADPVVVGVGSVDPLLLHEHALHPVRDGVSRSKR
jgi:hypothetical protein